MSRGIVILATPDIMEEKLKDITDEVYVEQMEQFMEITLNRLNPLVPTNKYDHPAYYGYFEFLKQLHSKKIMFDTNSAYNAAARGGKLLIMFWLEKEFGEIKENIGKAAMIAAATNGQLEVVRHLSDRFTIDVNSYPAIVTSDKLDIIMWMIEQDKYKDFFDNENVINALFKDNVIDILVFYMKSIMKETDVLKQHNIDTAARLKQVKLLKYLSDNEIYPSKQCLDFLFSQYGTEYIKGDFGKWYVMSDIELHAINIPNYTYKSNF